MNVVLSPIPSTPPFLRVIQSQLLSRSPGHGIAKSGRSLPFSPRPVGNTDSAVNLLQTPHLLYFQTAPFSHGHFGDGAPVLPSCTPSLGHVI